jgi:tail assembly chaperone
VEPSKFKVGERTIRTRRFTTLHGLEVLARLSALVGPAIGAAYSDGGKDVGKLIATAFDHLTPADVLWLVEEFREHSEVDLTGKGMWVPLTPDAFEQSFDGDHAAVVAWAVHCLGVNFRSFLPSIGARFGGLLKRAPSTSESPTG